MPYTRHSGSHRIIIIIIISRRRGSRPSGAFSEML
jgi:hypothetical protein